MSSNNADHIIDLIDVIKSYQTEAGEFTVLKNIALSVGPGEFVGVIGKSGSGKSTLINMITGIDRPTSGQVNVNHTPIHTLNEGQVAQWRGRNIGIVFQFFQLLPTLTVLENIIIPMDFAGRFSRQERLDRAHALLQEVDLADQAHKLPSQLSGGQQQRVAIARSLANDPPIIVADEPTGNLDSMTSERIFKLFEKLVKDGKTILVVTHDSDQAKRVARTIIISDGKIIEEHLKKAFPALSDSQLAWATSKMQRHTLHPGEIIIQKGEKHGNLYIVTKGVVEIILEPGQRQIVVAEFKKGEYFGEIELLRKDPKSVATARASIKCSSGVEVATLDRETFLKLISTSRELKQKFGTVAARRLQENIATMKSK